MRVRSVSVSVSVSVLVKRLASHHKVVLWRQDSQTIFGYIYRI